MELNPRGKPALFKGGLRGIDLGAARVLEYEGINIHVTSRTTATPKPTGRWYVGSSSPPVSRSAVSA